MTIGLLPREYYLASDVVSLAKDLIGKYIRSATNNSYCMAMITETEAYRAPEDRASHAFGNRRTARTEVMFGNGGHAYIYLNYGLHHLFNVVTGPPGTAHAILIRAVIPVENGELMVQRRKESGFRGKERDLFNGPGKLSFAMGISTAQNGADLCNPLSPIVLLDGALRIPEEQIMAGPRIGIEYAKEWAEMPWRFQLKETDLSGPVL